MPYAVGCYRYKLYKGIRKMKKITYIDSTKQYTYVVSTKEYMHMLYCLPKMGEATAGTLRVESENK